MRNSKLSLPLALYIHIPWCVKKCPYCDFNSHALKQDLPEKNYVDALLEDLRQDVALVGDRKISTIFIGGGTPSLFSPVAIESLLKGVQQLIPFEQDIEITLEANPGTVEQKRFSGFREAGVNRLSIGVQSFNDDHLKRLGRIHDSLTAKKAIEAAHSSGFDNVNIDLMFALPKQTEEEALWDLEQALSFETKHLSWYQLTIEPNTLFHHRPPVLPIDEAVWSMQQSGQAFLAAQGYAQYEISAYAKKGYQCRHNRHYWTFSDYLGIGAGAHGKVTDEGSGQVRRSTKTRHPKAYLDPATPYIQSTQLLAESDLILEFMLNALRLYEPIPLALFRERTGLCASVLQKPLALAKEKGLLESDGTSIETTALGKQHLNELLLLFS